MAPSLTAAEILARRKNYASSFKNRASVYNKENKMPAAAKEEALNQKESGVKSAAAESKEKLKKWMEEKRKKDMEMLRKKKEEEEEVAKTSRKEVGKKKTANPKAMVTKVNSETKTSQNSTKDLPKPKLKPTNGIKESQGNLKTLKDSASDPTAHPQAARPKQVKKPKEVQKTISGTPANTRRVTFGDMGPVRGTTSATSSCQRKSTFRKTPRKTPLSPSLSTATPTRMSSKKFETLSPHSKFDHWLQMKGKTSHDVKHIGCVTPITKGSVSKLPVSQRKSFLAKEGGIPSSTATILPQGEKKFQKYLEHLKREEDIHLTKASLEAMAREDASCVGSASYWICLAYLSLVDSPLTAPQLKRKLAFDTMATAIENQASPKWLLAKETEGIIMKMYDLPKLVSALQDHNRDSETDEIRSGATGVVETTETQNGTFTLEEEGEIEEAKNGDDTFTKDHGLEDLEELKEAAILTPPASPPSPVAAAIVGTPIAAATPGILKPFSLDPMSPPSPPLLEFNKPSHEGQTSTPTLSCDGAEVDSLNGTGASFLDDVTGYVEDASVCSEEADFSLSLSGSCASPVGASASLVTTTPHFVGLRRSTCVAGETRTPGRSSFHIVEYDDVTGMSSGCSSMHDVTHASTRAAYDSNESLQVVELENDSSAAEWSIQDHTQDITDSSLIDGMSLDDVEASLSNLMSEDDSEDKENVSPRGQPDVCSEMSHDLPQTPVSRKASTLPKPQRENLSQPYASSAVRLLMQDGVQSGITFSDGVQSGVTFTDGVTFSDDIENVTPCDVPAEESPLPPTALQKSALKSASKSVVTPVRRSVRHTPRVQATEEKRHLVDDLSELSPDTRANSILVPNPTILNLSFAAQMSDEEDEVM